MPDPLMTDTGIEDARRVLEASTVAVVELQPPQAFDELAARDGIADAESGAITEEAVRLLRGSEMTWLNESAVRMLGAQDKADAKRSYARWTSSRAKQSVGITQLMVTSMRQPKAKGDFVITSGTQQIDVEMSLSSFRDTSGRIRFLVTLHDVTSDLQAVRDLEQQRAELEAALATSTSDLEVTEERLAATTELILSLVALRDDYTSSHMRDAAQLADLIAEKVDCPAAVRSALNTAALVHDVGKLAVPADLLSKSGRLSVAEMMLMKEHARIGGELLAAAGFAPDVVQIAAQHHERWDGSGYPGGLQAEQACLGARILAVADTIVSMGYHRPYRAALPPHVVYEEIESGSDVRYDPAVADAALSILRDREGR